IRFSLNGDNVMARVAVTVGALLPYWRFLAFNVVFITDDYFASDIFSGELPGRVLVGETIRQGHLPVWTNRLCSGLPLAGVALDPIGIGPFVLLPPAAAPRLARVPGGGSLAPLGLGPSAPLPPAAALDLVVIVLLLVAAHGTYGLARRFGADRT